MPRSRQLAREVIAEMLQERYVAACQAVKLQEYYIDGGLKFMAKQSLSKQRRIAEDAERVAAGETLEETED